MYRRVSWTRVILQITLAIAITMAASGGMAVLKAIERPYSMPNDIVGGIVGLIMMLIGSGWTVETLATLLSHRVVVE